MTLIFLLMMRDLHREMKHHNSYQRISFLIMFNRLLGLLFSLVLYLFGTCAFNLHYLWDISRFTNRINIK